MTGQDTDEGSSVPSPGIWWALLVFLGVLLFGTFAAALVAAGVLLMRYMT